MNARIKYLRRRRQLLVSQAAAQRSEVSFISMQLKQRMQLVDTGFAIVQAIRIHPGLATVSASLLLLAPRNKLLLWSGRLFTSWEVFVLVRRQWRAIRGNKGNRL